jgi:hypothetical protein
MPLSATGCKADHLCVVSRIHNDDALMVVAARLPSRHEADPIGPEPRYLASTDQGLPIEEQVRKKWDPKKGGLPIF